MSRLEQIIEQLMKISHDPRKQLERYQSEGKKVVGCFPPYTPQELVMAAGMVPMGIWGSQTESYKVRAYVPAFCCPIMQSSLEMGLNGSMKGLSAVMIPPICDALRCITQNWKVGVPDIPMIPVTYPQNRTDAGIQFLKSEYEVIRARLEKVAGHPITEEDLKAALEISRQHSRAMLEFAEEARKHPDRITPIIRHSVMKSAWFMEKKEHLALVKELTEELKKEPECDWKGGRVILSGITGEPDELLKLLEEYGLMVDSDDLAQESRQYTAEIPEGDDALLCLAEQWKDRKCSLVHDTEKTRLVRMCETAKEHQVQGVITCMMKFCDQEEYDLPVMNAMMKKLEIPVLALEIDQQPGTAEQLRTRIQTFAEMICNSKK